MPFSTLHSRAFWLGFTLIILMLAAYLTVFRDNASMAWLGATYPVGSSIALLMLLLILTFVPLALWYHQVSPLRTLLASITGVGSIIIALVLMIGLIYVIGGALGPG